ncbi:MAG TPA: hypothetical protein VMR31_08740 [Myxococcota bacterium]|jgi:hypothetical protein|nr:hypothetical protein [Myxococcota bacterium]
MAAAGTHLFTIPGTIKVTHYPAQKALVGEWESLNTPDFRQALMRSMDEGKRLGAMSWIVDLTRNPSVPSQDDQKWVETFNVGNALSKGIIACINLHGSSAITKLGSRRWTRSAGEQGMITGDCSTLEEALKLAAQVASGDLR